MLTPHGSLVFELGDTYSGTGGATDNRDESLGGNDMAPRPARSGRKLSGTGGRTSRPDDVAAGITQARSRPGPEGRDVIDGWPLDKSLCMIPSSFAWALSYGRNPWTGRETEPWRVRNLVAWCRPNPPVGALGDKFRPGTSYLTVACKSRKRWFDLDAVRTEPKYPDDVRENGSAGYRGIDDGGPRSLHLPSSPGGAPPLDWWEIPTQPYPGAHYATFPEKLVTRPIEAMCPRQVCRQCGEPRRRITGTAEYVQSPNAHSSGRASTDTAARTWESGIAEGKNRSAELHDGGVMRVAPTLGWTDCGHNDYRRGVVLDPFAGSGTTLAVAEGHGRDSIGIDLDARNADLARARCGDLFLTIVEAAQLP